MKDIHPLLDKRSQDKARQYEKEKRLLGFASLFLSLTILLSFYFSGLSAALAHLDIGRSIMWTFLVYSVIFYSTITILGLPLAFFSGYIHEHKYKK